MGWLEITQESLKEVVEGLGPEFKTRDVSEDPRMTKAYYYLVGERNYHAFVGRALSEHYKYLGIVAVAEKRNKDRGMHWKKTALSFIIEPETHYKHSSQSTPDLIPQHIPVEELTNNPDFGPQYAGDSFLRRKMRKHQSWYRANVLKLPYSTGPKPDDTSYYGNMLTRSDGAAGRNFLTKEIFEVVLDRIAQGTGAVEKYRLLHNMLSSQPMCFNLFAPLVRDRDLAKLLLETLIPERITEITRFEIEWSPKPAVDYLNDHTAFDAFIEYRTTDGQLFGLGIETKLSEPFSQKEYDRPEYRRWMQLPNSPWLPESWNKVQAIGHNQLWREHLLAVAMRSHPKSTYAKVRLLLVHHTEDIECVRNYSNYKNHLQDADDTLFRCSLDQIVDLWSSVVTNEDQKQWLRSFKKRYTDLD